MNGVRWHWLEGGSGATLLLVHGFGADADNWLLLAAALRGRYRLIMKEGKKGALYEIYDHRTDPAETKDVYDSLPKEEVERLLALARKDDPGLISGE